MSLKELKDLLRVLRDNGVTEYVTSNLSVKLADEAMSLRKPTKVKEVSSSEADTEEVNAEDLLFYSAAAPASSDPK
jgi:hypothetical protein